VAWAGLADVYNAASQFGYMPPREGMEQARGAARRALELNPRLAEGHVALAAVIEAYDWDWAEAEREYKQAIQLSAGLHTAHLWYGMFLRDQGRLKEGLPELRRAAELAPYSLMACVNLSYALLAEGDYTAALEQARRALEAAPDLASAQVAMERALRAIGQTKDADAILARTMRDAGGDPHSLAVVVGLLARLGRREEAMQTMRRLEALVRERYVSPYDLGSASLALGDGDGAMDHFEEALRQRSSGLIFLRQTKAACLRDTVRFQSLLDKLRIRG
jgi:serine/threonine-protein kinase